MIKQLGCWCGICVLFMAGTSMARPAMAGPKKGVDHFYLGGSVGSAQINESDDIADFDFDTDGLGYKIFAGYNLGLGSGFDFAVEGSYVDFGRNTSSGAAYQDVECTAWDLFGVGKLDLGPIELFGKIGGFWWSGEIDAAEDVLNEFGDNLVYGAGAQIKMDSLAIRLEYERFDIDIANVDFVSLGASIGF
ncbi:MAG: outer membrane beta-barrel protein [Pontiellaceae bacterium]|nr:outer membrane beta-barrel protein [Pontiellaceae bacterium]MBN2783610.1 outer membrane beta-barrel protein [Pontiellaceae bacterium]